MRQQPPWTLLRRTAVVWLAVLVALLGALAPTLSHALALARGGAPMEMALCASAEPDRASAAPQEGQGAAPSLAHCPFCLHSTDRLAPASHPLPYLFGVADAHPEPVALQAFFYAQHRILAPPPRGPPLQKRY